MARRRQKLSYKIRQALQGPLVAAWVRALGLLPLRWNRRLGYGLGHLLWCMQSRSAQVVSDNIQRCFPELETAEQQAMAKASVMANSATLFEAASIWCQPSHRTQSLLLDSGNIQLCREKMASGRGLLLLVPHLGNWEMLGAFLPKFFPTSFMFQPSAMPQLDEIIRNGRSREGIAMVPTNTKGVAALLKALKRGELAGILPDQVPDYGSGAVANFFGQPAYTMTLVHKLLQRTGCEIAIAYCKRVDKGFELVFESLPAAVCSEDTTESLGAMNQAVEACVRDVPEQYQWTYKRFKLPSELRKP